MCQEDVKEMSRGCQGVVTGMSSLCQCGVRVCQEGLMCMSWVCQEDVKGVSKECYWVVKDMS